jgi:hypothetical protein
VLVSHACNPSYLGGWDWEDCRSRPAQANSLRDPAKWTRGTAQAVECLLSKCEKCKALSSNPSPTKKKKKDMLRHEKASSHRLRNSANMMKDLYTEYKELSTFNNKKNNSIKTEQKNWTETSPKNTYAWERITGEMQILTKWNTRMLGIKTRLCNLYHLIQCKYYVNSCYTALFREQQEKLSAIFFQLFLNHSHPLLGTYPRETKAHVHTRLVCVSVI